MAKKRRKIYLHVGTQKTGSSYLQHLLRQNAATLYDAGVSYLQFEEDLVGSGNGAPLIDSGVKEGVAPPFDLYFGKHSTAIVSSELMYSAGFNWLKTFRAAKAENIQIVVVAYFRNPVGYLLSSYSQNVSRHGYAKSLEAFVSEFPIDLYVDPLKKAMRATEVSGVKVEWHLKSYDACRDRLFEEFLLGCDLTPRLFAVETGRVNPSLNADQLKLLQIYNSQFRNDVASAFAKYVVDEAILEGRPALAMPKVLRNEVERKFADALEWINKSITGPPVAVSAGDELPEVASEPFALDEGGVCKLIDFFAAESGVEKGLRAILDRVQARCGEVHSDVLSRYPDFDPVRYLIKNPDLLFADVNPYRHFNDHGAGEGRTYKFAGTAPVQKSALVADVSAEPKRRARKR